jgi:hypothetical protein
MKSTWEHIPVMTEARTVGAAEAKLARPRDAATRASILSREVTIRRWEKVSRFRKD